MYRPPLKSVTGGVPPPDPPSGVDLAAEARRARRRLYPVTIVYSLLSLSLLGLGLRARPLLALIVFAGGCALWTLVEYAVHRYVLHGVFPDGRAIVTHLLHVRFDHLHWQHHKRPWDGDHINGTLRDTAGFVAPLVAVSFVTPLHAVPALLAGLLLSYVAEEWVHHSVHHYDFRGRYFGYIKRHHHYHHARPGAGAAFGLTSGLWDRLFGTPIPEPARRAVFDPALPTPYTRESARSEAAAPEPQRRQ